MNEMGDRERRPERWATPHDHHTGDATLAGRLSASMVEMLDGEDSSGVVTLAEFRVDVLASGVGFDDAELPAGLEGNLTNPVLTAG
ncbi:hypothetical protein [Ilumatobacter sp.]|uniref:hypothetical protein n=1 Tax=Ilumatobacter sp. TaxID=1967498 RepID=UPI003AF4C6A8